MRRFVLPVLVMAAVSIAGTAFVFSRPKALPVAPTPTTPRSAQAVLVAPTPTTPRLGQVVHSASQGAFPVQVRVELPRATFRGDEPVDVAVTLVNQGTQTEELGGSASELSAFRLDLKHANGSPVARTAFGSQTLTPPTEVLKNALTFVPPGGKRRITFPLRRMFDLSAGGSFSLRVSRVFEKYVRTATNQFRDASTVIAAPPVAFSVAPASSFAERPHPPRARQRRSGSFSCALRRHARAPHEPGRTRAFGQFFPGRGAPDEHGLHRARRRFASVSSARRRLETARPFTSLEASRFWVGVEQRPKPVARF